MDRFSLGLLGAFEACRSPASPPIRLGRKPQALLAYLAFVPGRAHARDHLATLLWEDVDQEQARQRLRQTLFALRKSLGAVAAGLIVTAGETVTVAADAVDVDVTRFETLATASDPAALEGALALYRGDLLAGLRLDEPAFEDWLGGERERLRRLALAAGERLLDTHRAGGETERAIQVALRVLTIDPAREVVHRGLMTLYAATGQVAAATRQYDRCVRALRRELSVTPGPETRRLHQTLLAALAPPEDSPAPAAVVQRRPPIDVGDEPPLAGREAEVRVLHQALDDLWRGAGRRLMLLGPAGIGKSRLIHHLALEAWRRSGRVLIARCHETEQSLPFAPWIDAFRAGQVIADVERAKALQPVWRRELSRLFPELHGSAPRAAAGVDKHPRVFDAIGELVSHLAGQQPLVLVLEDAHWADEPSLRLLAYLGHRMPKSHLLTVATVRTGEDERPVLRQLVHELSRDPRASLLRLDPLAEAETVALVRTLAAPGVDAERLAAEVWRASKGHPFLAVETCRELMTVDAPRDAGSVPLSDRWRDMVRRRLDRVSGQARRLLDAGAVLGRAADGGLLGAVTGLAGAEVTAGLDELLRREVFQSVDTAFDFAHDRLREAAYADMPGASRLALHRAVAAALTARHRDDLGPVRATLAYHCQQAGLWLETLEHARQACTRALLYGALREAAAACECALAALRELPETPERLAIGVDIRIDLRHALVTVGDSVRVGQVLDEAERLARSLDDHGRLGVVLGYLAHHHWWHGEYDAAVARCEEGFDVARTSGDRNLVVSLPYYESQAAHGVGDYRRAAERARATHGAGHAGITSRRFGSTDFTRVLASSWLTWCLAELGDFGEATEHVRDAVRIADAGGHPLLRLQAYAAAAMCEFRRGDLDAALSWSQRRREVARTGTYLGPLPEWFLLHAYALLGRPEAASMLSDVPVPSLTGPTVPYYVPLWLSWFAEAQLLVNGAAAAAPLAGQALALARARGERGHEAWILHLHGDVALAGERSGAAEAELWYRQALDLAVVLGMRPLQARCHLGLAAVFRRAGAPAAADRHRRTAEDLAAVLEMQL